jgi:uncharacterized membrane protein YphA (DoxX/SURF4 family)
MQSNNRLSNTAPVAMRMALAGGFFSAVADRFGLWGPIGTPGVSWGGFARFLDYTATLLPFLPTTLVAVAGWAATVAETLLGVVLLAGVRVRLAALASGVLLLTFAVAMTTALGPEAPLSYSVWTAAAGAFLLAHNQPTGPRALHPREEPSTEAASSGIPSGPVSTCNSQYHSRG